MKSILPSFDLATVLVALMVFSGLVALYDMLVLVPKRKSMKVKLIAEASQADLHKAEHIPLVVDLSRSLFPVFLVVLLLRSFLVEPFRIPSNSMMPTLLTGDFILVNKFSYGLRLPVIHSKILDIGEPQRGDVVVFRYPKDPSQPYIKRVVGIPGDHIVYHNTHKMLYINGDPIAQKVMGIYQGVGSGSGMTGAERRSEEIPTTLSTTVTHDILIKSQHVSPTAFNDLVLKEKQYFVLGDNRDNSRDSRYWGIVPEENLIGKAFFIWMNWDMAYSLFDWERIGTSIE